MYKFLTRKNVVLDAGLKASTDDNLIYKFDNMKVAVPAGTATDSVITLATLEELDEKVKASITGSHKSIAGEFPLNDASFIPDFISEYNSGKDMYLNNGRIFNNGNASPGEIIFVVKLNPDDPIIPEEFIVGAHKELIQLTNSNNTMKELGELEVLIVNNANAIETKATTSDVDAKVAVETYGRQQADVALDARIKTLEADTTATTNKGLIDAIQLVDDTQNGRIEALEIGETLVDKVWTGDMTLTAHNALASLTDQDGTGFDFIAGKRLEVLISDDVTKLEQGQLVVVGSGNAKQFTIGTKTIGASLDTNGNLVITGADLSDLKLVELREAHAAKATSLGYTKNESDGKYATISSHNTLSSQVSSNLAALSGKQDTIDQGLISLTTKSVVGAINENFVSIASMRGDVDSVSTGNFDVFGNGSFVLAMFNPDGSITDAFKAMMSVKTDAELNTLIDARVQVALNTAMDVTFDDTSTGAYKIAK